MGTPSYVAERPQTVALDPLPALLTRTAQGDRAAFKQVYDLTSPQLFGVALRMLRRRDLAEDLLQDAFLAIWQKASQYTIDRGTPMAWMAMIVRHRAIDRLRMAKRRPLETDIEDASPSDVSAEAPTSSPPVNDVTRVLTGLPDNQRKAVTLAFVEGLTHEELAIRLNAPLGTVKSWVRRGLLAMKESLQS